MGHDLSAYKDSMNICTVVLSGLLRDGFRKVEQTLELLYSAFTLYEQTETV